MDRYEKREFETDPSVKKKVYLKCKEAFDKGVLCISFYLDGDKKPFRDDIYPNSPEILSLTPLLNDKERVESIERAMKLVETVNENTWEDVSPEAKLQATICIHELKKLLSHFEYRSK